MQWLAVRMLTLLGCAPVTTADDGVEALSKLRGLPTGPGGFDVILMDLSMPLMGGVECAKAIARAWPGHGTPVVAVTADSSDEARACLKAGFAVRARNSKNFKLFFFFFF